MLCRSSDRCDFLSNDSFVEAYIDDICHLDSLSKINTKYLNSIWSGNVVGHFDITLILIMSMTFNLTHLLN